MLVGVGFVAEITLKHLHGFELVVVKEIKKGERIFAKADDLEVVIELKKITRSVTRLEIKAGEGVVKRDTATATEIVQKTTEIAETLVT